MKMRAAANRFTPRDFPNSSRMVFEDFALPSSEGRRIKPATKMTPSSAAIIHSAWVNPTRSSNRPPTKNPMPFIAFFEPVNPGHPLEQLTAAFGGGRLDRRFGRRLGEILGDASDALGDHDPSNGRRNLHPGSSADNISKPAIWSDIADGSVVVGEPIECLDTRKSPPCACG